MPPQNLGQPPEFHGWTPKTISGIALHRLRKASLKLSNDLSINIAEYFLKKNCIVQKTQMIYAS